jgi:MATE family multidrug resistance protein
VFRHVPGLLKLALPLILSSSTITLMQIVDAYVLSLHSSAAVAAMGPSSLAVILFQGFLFGIASYAGTFVAHNHGRGDATGINASAWLGIQTSLVSGLAALALAWPVGGLFLLVGHEPEVAQAERAYFWICMAGSVFPVLGGALGGWLAGIGRASAVTWVTFAAFAVNAVLDWGLVLGQWGLPRMGIAGAALGTVLAQAVAAGLYVMLFAMSGGLGDRLARRFRWSEFRHFLSLATPMGLRISIELAAWTAFLLILGRLGTVELAASSIAFRINGLAFFPAMGLAQAAGILVGQARGAGRDWNVLSIAWQSLAVCELWLLAMAVLFATASAPLVGIFAGQGPESGAIIETGSVIMKFVAAYCLIDAANIVFGGVLAAAGDTRWIARAFFFWTCAFVAALWLADAFLPNLILEWTLATLYVLATAVVWTVRVQSGAWRRARVLSDSGH